MTERWRAEAEQVVRDVHEAMQFQDEQGAVDAILLLIERVQQETRKRKCIDCGVWITDGDYDLCPACDLEDATAGAGAASLSGVMDGVLYCYGGCGRRYSDFPLDVNLPTPLWNQIAVGPPFDETQQGIEREGRGGVLCASCIVERLATLPGVTHAIVTVDTLDTPAASPSGERQKEQCPYCKEWCAHGFCGRCERVLGGA